MLSTLLLVNAKTSSTSFLWDFLLEQKILSATRKGIKNLHAWVKNCMYEV
jgi:hypothetical protein